ncbi:uncharacterized protein Z518_02101 [Rhinocladiella mackenziei CBS 650.93]|uniref:Xylanolytic transcriptional activator regulatory domain-containing protein n=1 Tax=Rhinocladiella mackenziei CBS 650.93 TaxID=1442369 RepID=A0A0D2HAF3_9EURO|nr:uncharacterized protein Z518_02101 [Rhinocladiella mackenziei CBS 650.93]KIX07448.1 hypothetical protein Z518_02101 [Rhinocladiella mackenziei CBS 650.93]
MSSQPAVEHVPWGDVRASEVHHGPSSHYTGGGQSASLALEGSRSQTTGANRNSPLYPMQPTAYAPPLSRSSASLSSPNIQTRVPGEAGFTGQHQHQGSPQRPDELSPSEHSVHAIIGATLDEDGREGFFGSSSAGTFMQNVRKMVQQKVGGGAQQTGQPSWSPHLTHISLASGRNPIKQKHVDYVLPTRRRADILVSAYWKYVHVLYPYLDKVQIQEDYEKLWKGDDSIPDERSLMCLLNVIFALASQIDESTPIEERERSAHVFYTRAKELLDIVETGSVRTVQVYLLLGQYFQSTNEPHPCWVYTGVAIRTAQSLGLNLPETTERITDLRTRELLRKVWHGCILMDRVVSMTYGRPCMIGPRAALAVPLPLPVDEEYLVPGSFHTPPVPVQPNDAAVEFYVLSLKLYEILHDVIFNFYSVNFGHGKPVESDKYFGSLSESQSSVFEIEHRIVRWEQSIPDHLRVGRKPQSHDANATRYRQAVILHQRQDSRPHTVRQYVTDISQTTPRSPVTLETGSLLSHRIFLQCAIVCVRVALEAINTIHQERGNNDAENGYLAAWWYNVLYLYTSATVLIAARLSSAILADVSEETILDGWHKAMDVLKRYSLFSASIKRLTTTLTLLFEAVPRQYSRFKENSRQVQTDTSPLPQNQGQGSVPLPYWRLLDSVDLVSTPVDNLPREQSQDDNNALPDDSLLDFDRVFDPNDLSWLMTIPLDG